MHLSPGVETLTVSGAAPGAHLRVCDADGQAVATLVADGTGQAHLAFVPAVHRVLATPEDVVAALSDGWPLPPGEYTVVDESASPPAPARTRPRAGRGRPPRPVALRAGAARGLRLRDRARRRAAVGDGPVPQRGPLRPGPVAHGGRVLGLRPLRPRQPPARHHDRQPAGLRRGRREHAGHGVLGRRLRHLQPGPGGRRLRRHRDRGPPALGAPRPGGHGGAQLPRYQPALRGRHPAAPPGRHHPPVGHRRPLPPAVARRDLQLRVHPGLGRHARRRDHGRRHGLGPGPHRRRRHRRRGQPADPHPEPRLRGRRPGHPVLRPAVRAASDRPPGGPDRRPGVPDRGLAGRADREPVRHHDRLVRRLTGLPVHRLQRPPPRRLQPHGARPVVRVPLVPRGPPDPAPARAHPDVRPGQFLSVFGYEAELEPDRFTHHGDDFDAALAEYLAEPRMRLLFENGAGSAVVGATSHRFETSVPSFPPPGVGPGRWWFDVDGALVDRRPGAGGAETYEDDPEAGELAYSKELLDDLDHFTRPTTEIARDWTRFADRHRVAFETARWSGPWWWPARGTSTSTCRPARRTRRCRPPSPSYAPTDSSSGSRAAGTDPSTGWRTPTAATGWPSTTPSPRRTAPRWSSGSGSRSACPSTRSPTSSGPGRGSG